MVFHRKQFLLSVSFGVLSALSACAQSPVPPKVDANAAKSAAQESPRAAVLEVRPDKPRARIGESVNVVIEVVNRSDKPLRFKTRQVFLNLRIDVRQPDGTCCVYNPYHRLRVNPVDAFDWAEIAPGGRLEIARLTPVVGESFEARAWQTYKVRGRPVDWFERFPLGPDGRIIEDSLLPKPFSQKGLHNIHASYALPSKEPGVVTAAESAIVDFTVAP